MRIPPAYPAANRIISAVSGFRSLHTGPFTDAGSRRLADSNRCRLSERVVRVNGSERVPA